MITFIYKCPAFELLTSSARFKCVKERNACVNCLSIKHKLRECQSNLKCRTCHQRHHTLLHFNRVTHNGQTASTSNASIIQPTASQPSTNSIATNVAPNPANAGSCTPLNRVQTSLNESPTSLAVHSRDVDNNVIRNIQNIPRHTILLSTAQVIIYDNFGKPHIVKCLLDSASQSNFITYDCCQRLGLSYDKNSRLTVRGIGGCEKVIKGTSHFRFFSRFDSSIHYDISGLVVDRITDNLPTLPVDTTCFSHIMSLPLADNTFHSPSTVDVLLGAELFLHLMLPNTVHSNVQGVPPAIQTMLGYIVVGAAPVLYPSYKYSSTCCTVVEDSLNSLKRFWELEEVSISPVHNQDDLECETFFQRTTTRGGDGRYTVGLPFCDDVYKLGESFSTANKRFLCLERKLQNSKMLRIAYDEIIRSYLDNGYINKVANNIGFDSISYFIPHHAVVREDKTSTKVRMVLDSSCKTSSGLSINDVLHSGENLQGDLFNIILNFRLFKIALSADCRQMFLQIVMRESDRKYQRILYRFHPQEPITVYEFNRVCFGMKSSPFHALRVVHQLIADERSKFPKAAEIASRATYMDDVCFSIMADLPERDETAAIAISKELINLFKSGQFDLVKWTCNSDVVLSQIPASHRASVDLEIDKNVPQKVLGMLWSKSGDYFHFKVITPDTLGTKRAILSTVARLWDVVGLLAPTILYAKLLIQELWLLQCDWDDTPPCHITNLWQQFCIELPRLNEIRIPRHLGVVQGCTVNILGFADASERGYGSVIYLQVINGTDISIRLVCSKSKVSPLKTVSVARLELCAVVLLSKLMRKVYNNFDTLYKLNKVYGFTDSKVVLCWINSSPHRWQTFVANRVVKILDNLPANCFYHVAGVENPADCLSRGLTPSKLLNHPLWFNGPTWASRDPSEWPIQGSDQISVQEIPEAKPGVYAIVTNDITSPIYVLAQRISSWSKLLKVIVFIFRFIKRLPRTYSLSNADLNFAENQVLRVLQHKHFEDDIRRLKSNDNCSSTLQKLKPFLDDSGLIRVGGRLSNSSLEYTHKHPCVLPRHDHIVNTLIDYYHIKYLHAGPELLMSLLRTRYWILAARSAIRHRIHKCNTCFKAKPQPHFPLMSDLPDFRVNRVDKPFSHTGCDYAGPVQYTPIRGRGVKSRKAWLCIFTCMTTRCVHIEIATELSTASFLAALRRFLSRRGPVQCIHSDHGTNFVGARSYLRDLYKFLNKYRTQFEYELAEQRIEWKFIPPLSPHFGGCWESMVKVIKSHLFKVIGLQILSYEELSTVLAQVEALLNSRPLTILSSDPVEPSALTPAHFLHTTPLLSLPAPYSECATLRDRYSLLDKMVQSFWQRWRVDYLHQLQSRAKWNTSSTTIGIGTIVIIMTDHAPPLAWPLGIIEAVHPSKDGITRVATVRTNKGSFVRPIVKLCPLPNQ